MINVHPFMPIYNKESKILILGSFPSVKSREQNFYYAHPKNRFWQVISNIYKKDLPINIDEKINLILNNKLAIWDVIESCEIKNSSDMSIKNAKVNDILAVINNSNINKICFNGKTAFNIFNKVYDKTLDDIKICVLPSTSPANAKCTFDNLIDIWSDELIDK